METHIIFTSRHLFSRIIFVLCLVNQINGQGLNEHYFAYKGNYPSEENTGWHENAQGVTHNLYYWFFTNNGFKPLQNGGATPNPVVWKIPVTHDLKSVSKNDPGVLRKEIGDFPELKGYNHFGDPSMFTYENDDYLLIPLEGQSLPAGLGIFKGADLQYIGHVPFSHQRSAGWVAVKEGFIYTSEMNTAHVLRYELDWRKLKNSGEVHLKYLDYFLLKNEYGFPLVMKTMQGGVFSPSGRLLYLISGYYECVDENVEGIHVIDTKCWQRIKHSTNGFGTFNFEWHPGLPTNEEPEGLTIWDLDNGVAPGISGQLHVILLDNDQPDSDDVYFKHYARVPEEEVKWCEETGESQDATDESCWSAVGAAAIVDESVGNVVSLGSPAEIFVPNNQAFQFPNTPVTFDGAAFVNKSKASAYSSLRFNIGQFDELPYNKDNILELKIRYLVSDKSKQRVVAYLKRYEISPNISENPEKARVLGMFDSFNFPNSPMFQTQKILLEMNANAQTGLFNFEKYAYYIEVILIKYSQTPGPNLPIPTVYPPALGAIQLCESVRLN